MAVLLPTSTFTLLSPRDMGTPGEDWGGAPDADTGYVPASTPIPGTLSVPSGAATFGQEGATVGYVYDLILDPCQVTEDMLVRDEATGQVYQVQSVVQRAALIPSTRARVTRTIASA